MAKHNEDPNDDFLDYGPHFFNSIINNIDDLAIFFINPEGKIQLWNSGAENLLLFSRDEVLGKHFSLTYPNDSIEKKYPEYVLKKVKEAGKFEHIGWRRRKDNTGFWAKSKTSAVYNKKSEVIGYYKIIQSMDEIKKSAESIKDSEGRYKMLVNSVTEYTIFMMDNEGRISTWNSGAEQLLGYKTEEVLNQPFSILYTQEDQDANFPQLILEKVRQEGKFEFESWRRKKNGGLFWASTIVNAIKDSNFNIVGFSNITRDLSARKMAESDLWESEEKYRTLVEGVQDYAIILLDKDGYVKSWNIGAERLKGYKTEEIIGKHFSVFYEKEAKDSKFPQFELEKALEDGKYEHEGWRVRKDGSTFWTNSIIRPLFSEKGSLIGYSKISRDLTFRKKIEDELNKKNKELLKINEDLDNFIYAVSHDLRVPISNLEGLVDAIIKTMPPECQDPLRELFQYTKKSIDNLKDVVKDLSEIGRIQKEENIEVVKVKFQELIEEFEVVYKKQIEENNAQIHVDLQVEEIYFSKKNLRSIMQNLLINAINYKSSSRRPEISVKTYEEGDYVVLCVSDNGMGIKKEHLTRIFEMFKRIYTHVEGTGIGLYIIKRIMDNVEGKIEVDSEINKGTTFRLFFPKSKAT